MKHLKRILLTLAAACLLTCFAGAADNLNEFYEELMQNLQEQRQAFVIEYTGDISDLHGENGSPLPGPEIVRNMAATVPNEHGNGADPVMMNLRTASCGIDKDNRLHFTVEYLLKPEQLDWVNGKAQQLVKELELRGEPDFIKIRTIYEYVATHFTYDKTLSRFTDYDGLTTGSMVCQGYALLTYRMMWAAGIPCRIVVGTSRGEAHGWNIVLLDGVWYNLDTTWDSLDSEAMTWDYFLKGEGFFLTHQPTAQYTRKAFTNLHPISKTPYPVNALKILVDGTAYTNLIIRNGKDLTLELDTPISSEIQWTSTNPAVVSVDENGHIVSLTPGETIITATAEDSGWLPGQLFVTGVDMTTCSDWAEAELTSYYLRKLYPAELCHSYQNPITREELAHLVYQLLSQYGKGPGLVNGLNFRDVSSSPYWYSILYVTGRHIFRGVGDRTFDPQGLVTREMAAKVLTATLEFMKKMPELKGEKTAFADGTAVSDWAKDYVDAAVELGIFEGDANGNFNPKEHLSREMAAVIMERMFLKYVDPALTENAA